MTVGYMIGQAYRTVRWCIWEPDEHERNWSVFVEQLCMGESVFGLFGEQMNILQTLWAPGEQYRVCMETKACLEKSRIYEDNHI